MRITASAQTDIGSQRDHNEDACLVDHDLGLYIVCDGMGGQLAGEVASQETIRIVQEVIRRQQAIVREYIQDPSFEHRIRVMHVVEEAVETACAEVYAMGQRDPEKTGMGTTVVLLLALGEAVMIAHAGDSRIYLIRDHQVHQLTEDHSLVRHMLKSGRLTREEAANWPYAHVITRSVGTKATVQVDSLFVECLSKDRFVLCSDGFHNYLDQPEELARMSSQLSLDDLVTACISRANAAGGKDNITVIAIQVDAVRHAGDEAGISVTRKIEALRHIRLFRSCSEPELVKILNIMHVRSYKTGDIILKEDTVGDEFFILLAGQVDICKEGQHLLTLGPGTPFGETALLEDTSRSATVRALVATKVMLLYRQDFYAMLEQEPTMAMKLLRSFVLALHQRLCATSAELVEARSVLASLQHDTLPETTLGKDLPSKPA